MKIKKLTNHLFSILVVSLLFATMQCYTTFKHPQISSYSDSTDVYHSEEISFIDDCYACHEQDDPVDDSHLQIYDYPVYEDNYSWQYYYAIPWWVDDYYYETRTPNAQKPILPAPQRRNYDRRAIPPSTATTSSGVSGGSLSKPASDNSTTSTPSQSAPPKRNERRQITSKNSNSNESTQSGPAREKREDKKTKKEKK